MAKCANCSTTASCSCVFTNGLCSSCYRASQEKVKPAYSPPKVQCTYTLSQLQELKDSLLRKESTTKIEKYQILILNAQIEVIDTQPCKYQNIITNLIL